MDNNTIRQRPPGEIIELLNSKDEKKRELGYEYFLGRTHWLNGSTPSDLKKLMCMLLFLDPEKVRANHIVNLTPERLWASQSGLEGEKIDMVRAAHNYITVKGGALPPIVVMDFFSNALMRYMVLDGHHRCYYSHQLEIPVTAVVLEPFGNYHEAEIKLAYAFQLKTRVISLPVY